MKNKGTIIFFSIALAIVSIYHLSFTYVTNKVENEIKALYTEGNKLDKLAYKHHIDSIDKIGVYDMGITNYTYGECKQRELNLGLDLQGGMNMVLEVSKSDIIIALAKAGNNENDENLLKAVTKAKQLSRTENGDFEDLFARAYKEIAPESNLAILFANKDNLEKIDYKSSDEEVVKYIKNEASSSVDRVYEVIETRVAQSSVSQPTLQKLDNGRISAELPGVDNPKRMRDLITVEAKLEFWEIEGNTKQNNFSSFKMLETMNKSLAAKLSLLDTSSKVDEVIETNSISGLEESSTEISTILGDSITKDSNSLSDEILGGETNSADSVSQTAEEFKKENPLYTILSPYMNGQNQVVESAIFAITNKKDIAQVLTYLNDDEEVRRNIPSNIKFAIGAKGLPGSDNKESNTYAIYALKGNSLGEPQLADDIIVDARPTTSPTGEIEVLMKMNDFGAKEWGSITKKNIGQFVAVVLDDKVYTAPVVKSAIENGISTISGNFDIREANNLSNVLKAGKLPAKLSIVAEDVVGPTIGADNTRAGLIALSVGFLAVILFMIAYYNRGGIIADIAVLANVFLILGVLSAYGAALTLPGIAGIVLTIGMAVDANVLIFERIKEELANGKAMKAAVSNGYAQAMWSIIDANVTTLIAGIILATTGSGPVYGFAVILIIGIITSLFTSLLFSRLIIEGRLAKGKSMSFSYSWSESVLKNTNFNFIKNRKKFYIGSAIVILAGVGAIFTKGISKGIDFKGGWSYQMQMDEKTDINSEGIKAILDNALTNSSNEVKTIGTDNKFKIVSTYLLEEQGTDIADSVRNIIVSSLAKNDVNVTEVLQSSKVGPTIAQNTRTKSTNRMIIAIILMFAYIVFRFKKWGFGLGATVALLHDVLIVFSLYAILGGIVPFALEIDQAFIAAILTVIGYSINDSVVVFDRVREYLRENKSEKDTASLINNAINDTLSRTIVTSLTTILVILILFLFGGDALRGFTFALLIGVIVGTYSSACIATPIVVDVERLTKKKEK